MENMIRKIVEADNEAKAIELETLKEKEELSKAIEEEAQKIYDKYMNEALETVKRNDLNEEKIAEKQWEEIQKKHKSAQIKLESDYELNCDKWVDTIVNRVLE
ncbi:MAG: hypothetical protein UHD05_07260 [Ruminococcus sp.]|nr:hypothetical protein [Ruminococcus sp.]